MFAWLESLNKSDIAGLATSSVNIGTKAMMTPEISSEVLRQDKWWTEWRKVDFSWAALAKHQVICDKQSACESTIQGFWRKNPTTNASLTDDELLTKGELEKDPSGVLWHIAHVPIKWNNGIPTWKSDVGHDKWLDFWAVLKDRIITEADDGYEAQFAGVVFGEQPSDWQWHELSRMLNVRFATCAFIGDVNFGINSDKGLSLRYCLFYRQASFDQMSVEGNVDLSDSTFLSNLSLCHSDIRGNFTGNKIHCFREVAILNNTIHGNTEICQSIFYGPSGFESTKFNREVKFSYCRFENLVSMADTEFGQDASFLSCIFSSEDLTFTGTVLGDFNLILCTLEVLNVLFMQFHKAAYFSATRCRQSTRFQDVCFCGKVSFRNSFFESDATFDNVSFHGLIEFHNVVFAGVADLSKCSFPKEAQLFHCAFRGAEFRRVADFTNSSFHAWGAFSETKFHQPVLFSRSALRSDISFDQALSTAELAVYNDSRENEKKILHDRPFAELEAAFQCLKVAMANQQARLEEQRFYRFELVARRRQKTTPFSARILSLLYERTSLSGTSIFLPVAWLVSMMVFFAFIYWALTETPKGIILAFWPLPLRPIDPNFISALTFSVRNVIQPFAVWNFVPAANNSTDQWLRTFLNTGGASYLLLIRLLATLQSIISTILLFLSALAVKRRFQVT